MFKSSIHSLKHGMQITVREADPADAEELLAYINRVGSESDFLAFGTGELMLTKDDERLFIERVKNHETSLMIVAESENQIVASLGFNGNLFPRLRHQGEFGITVLKRYWRRGIAGILMERFLEWAREGGIIRKINLKVRTDNIHAIHLYEKLGFEREGLIRREHQVKGKFHDVLLMGILID